MRKRGRGLPQVNKEQKRARRSFAARLLLCCLGLCSVAIILFQGWEALRSSAPVLTRITHQEQPIVRAASESLGKRDVNRAEAEDFQLADGVGLALAQRICDVRAERGGFRFIEELMDVPGIGEKRFEALSVLFYCPDSAQALEQGDEESKK